MLQEILEEIKKLGRDSESDERKVKSQQQQGDGCAGTRYFLAAN